MIKIFDHLAIRHPLVCPGDDDGDGDGDDDGDENTPASQIGHPA